MEFDAKTAIIIGFFCKPEEKEANRKCFRYACSAFLVSCLFFVKLTQKSCSFWGENSHVSYIAAVLTCSGSVDCEDRANEISVCVPTLSVSFEGDDSVEHIFTWQPTSFFPGLDNFKLQISKQCLFLFAIFLPGVTYLTCLPPFVFFFLWFLFSLFFFYHSSVYISMSSCKPPERNKFPRNVFKFAGLARKLATWRLVKMMTPLTGSEISLP